MARTSLKKDERKPEFKKGDRGDTKTLSPYHFHLEAYIMTLEVVLLTWCDRFSKSLKQLVKLCELQVTGKRLNLNVLKHNLSGPAFFISLYICIANCGFLSVYSFPLFNTYPRLT